MKRNGSAVWYGGLKDGEGAVSTGSGALKDAPYSFVTRFENVHGSNPEELIGAAHASCFSMALAAQLEKEGWTPESIETAAIVTLEKPDSNWAITQVHLVVVGAVSNIDPGEFQAAAEEAKRNCPVSRLLNARITLDASLKPNAVSMAV